MIIHFTFSKHFYEIFYNYQNMFNQNRVLKHVEIIIVRAGLRVGFLWNNQPRRSSNLPPFFLKTRDKIIPFIDNYDMKTFARNYRTYFNSQGRKSCDVFVV